MQKTITTTIQSMVLLLAAFHWVCLVQGLVYPGPRALNGGVCTDPAVCPCVPGRYTSNATRVPVDVGVRFHPASNPLPVTSAFQRSSTRSETGIVETRAVISGTPLEPIALQFWARTEANSTCSMNGGSTTDPSLAGTSPYAPIVEPLAALDRLVYVSNATITLVADAPATIRWRFHKNMSSAANGAIVLTNFTIEAPPGTEMYFVFNTSVGVWVVSPLLVVFRNVTDADRSLSIVESGNNWITALPCFATDTAIVLGQPISETVVLVLKDLAGYADPSLDGLPVSVNASFGDERTGSLRVTTATVPVLQGGFAFVDGIVVAYASTTDASSGDDGVPFYAPMQLSFAVAGVSRMYSSWISILPAPLEDYALGFAASSYLQGQSPVTGGAAARSPVSASAVLGVPMRRIVVGLLNSNKQRSWQTSSAQSPDVFVTATCSTATLSGNVAMIQSGIAVFDSLTFTYAEHLGPMDDNYTFVLTFRADKNALRSERPLYSEQIRVVARDNTDSKTISLRLRNHYNQLLPDDGRATAFRAPAFAPFPLPVAIEVLGVDGVVDPAAACVVRARGPLLKGSPQSAVPAIGVATFAQLQFHGAGARAGAFTFIQFSCEQDDAVANDEPAVLALMVVSPIWLIDETPNNYSAMSLRFQPSAFNLVSAPFAPSFGVAGLPLPPVVVELIRLDGSVATDVDDVLVTAVTGSIRIREASSWVKQGRAVFPGIMLYCTADTETTGCATRLHFIASATTSSSAGALDAAQLSTGNIALTPQAFPRYALKCSVDSFLQFGGQPLMVSLNYPIPPIGLGIFTSNHVLDTSALNVVIRVTLSSGALLGTFVQSPDTRTGTVWFKDLVIAATEAPLEPKLVFCAEIDPNVRTVASLAQLSYVVGSCVASGTITFQLPTEPIDLKLAPVINTAGSPLIHAPTEDVVFVNATNSSIVLLPQASLLQLRVVVLNAAQRVALPYQRNRSQVALRATFSTVTRSAEFALDTRPSVYPVSPFATFANVSFGSVNDVVPSLPVIMHVGHTIQVSADWIPWRPLYLGTVSLSYNATSIDAMAPALVAIVGVPLRMFDVEGWVSSMMSALRVPRDQVEVLRVRATGGASSGKAPTWLGTLVELRFLPPNVQSIASSSSQALTDRFLSWQEVCHQDDLKLLHALRRDAVPPYCDVFRLEEQTIGGQSCYASGEELCTCFVSVFETMPPGCALVDAIATLCSSLEQCTHPSIANGCAEFQSSVTLQYVMIGVYALLGALLVGLIALWRKDVLAKCWRENLGNRNRRDIEYAGLKRYRADGEHVDPGEDVL